MWLVEEWGVEKFKAAIEERMGQKLRPEVGVHKRHESPIM